MTSLVHQIYLGDNKLAAIEAFNHEISTFKTIPGYSYKLWEEEEIKRFLSEFYPNDVVLAFDSLAPRAFKADLAKYCILNVHGGWYSDLGNTLISLPTELDNIDMVLFRETHEMGSTYAVHMSMLYSTPNNVALRNSIDKVVRNVQEKNYGSSPWAVTANALFGAEIAKHHVDNPTQYLTGGFYRNPESRRFEFILDNGHKVALYKDQNNDVKNLSAGYHYMDMWANKDVYLN